MSNTITTLKDGAIAHKALSILHNKLIFVKAINKQYDNRFAVAGAKIGDSLLIKEPNQFSVRTGAVMDVQDVTETYQTLTLATQKGVDINHSSVDLTMSMDDFAQDILEPAMDRLAADIDSTVITGCYQGVYNHVLGTKGSAPVVADVQSARSLISKGLAPQGDRFAMLESLGMNGVVNDARAYFNPAAELSRQYDTGVVGDCAGFKFYETEMIPTHTQGTFADTDTPTVDVPTELTNGATTITIDSCTTAGTTTVGQVFTIAGVYAVNPETKAKYKHLQQFTCTAAGLASGGTLTDQAVSPTIYISGVKQNCYITGAGATEAVLTETVGGSGTLSTGYPQHMLFHKDAFTFVSADLEVPKDAHFAARKRHDGISLRIWRASDIVNDKFPCRIDVYFGYKVIRPEWACRISG